MRIVCQQRVLKERRSRAGTEKRWTLTDTSEASTSLKKIGCASKRRAGKQVTVQQWGLSGVTARSKYSTCTYPSLARLGRDASCFCLWERSLSGWWSFKDMPVHPKTGIVTKQGGNAARLPHRRRSAFFQHAEIGKGVLSQQDRCHPPKQTILLVATANCTPRQRAPYSKT